MINSWWRFSGFFLPNKSCSVSVTVCLSPYFDCFDNPLRLSAVLGAITAHTGDLIWMLDFILRLFAARQVLFMPPGYWVPQKTRFQA